MAIDTEEKRRSALGFFLIDETFPVADGTIDQGDRQHCVGLYSGILFTAEARFMGRIVRLTGSGKIQFDDDTYLFELVTPSGLVANVTLELPDADGAANQVLKTNGSGKLSWATPTSLISLQNAYTVGEDITMAAGKSIAIGQANNEAMLALNKTGAGAGVLLSFDNDGTGQSIRIVQDGNGKAIDIENYGGSTPINILNTGATKDINGNGSNWFFTAGGGLTLQGLVAAPATKTIASAAITITSANRNIKVNGEGAAPDTLSTITGGTEGQEIFLRKGDANITVDEAGNISVVGTSRALDGAADVLHLINNGSTWCEPGDL